MTEKDFIKKLTCYEYKAVAPFEIAQTPEEWGKIFQEINTARPKAGQHNLLELFQPLADMMAFPKCDLAEKVFLPTANKYTFPECNMTEKDLYRAVEELTQGFDIKECADLTKTLQPYRNKLQSICFEYHKTWGKIAPLEYVCQLLESKSKVEKELPKELATPEAEGYFKKAIELGLMDNDHKWLKKRSLLAYFALIWNEKHPLSKAKNRDMTTRNSFKPFEVYFGVDKGKLRLDVNDFQNSGYLPKEHELVELVFNE